MKALTIILLFFTCTTLSVAADAPRLTQSINELQIFTGGTNALLPTLKFRTENGELVFNNVLSSINSVEKNLLSLLKNPDQITEYKLETLRLQLSDGYNQIRILLFFDELIYSTYLDERKFSTFYYHLMRSIIALQPK